MLVLVEASVASPSAEVGAVDLPVVVEEVSEVPDWVGIVADLVPGPVWDLAMEQAASASVGSVGSMADQPCFLRICSNSNNRWEQEEPPED